MTPCKVLTQRITKDQNNKMGYGHTFRSRNIESVKLLAQFFFFFVKLIALFIGSSLFVRLTIIIQILLYNLY